MKSVVIAALLLAACSERPLPFGSGVDDGGALSPGPIGSREWPGARYLDSKGQAPTLFSAWGSGPNDVYLVGSLGAMLHSSDRGRTWQALPHPIWAGIDGRESGWYGVWGSGPTDVYAVGECDFCLFHSNGDLRWSQMPGPLVDSRSAIWGSGPDDVYSTGSGDLIHTDGSGIWREDPNTDPFFGVATLGIWGSDRDHVFAVTHDGQIGQGSGVLWRISKSGVTSRLWDVWGADLSDIYVVGDGGVIFHSSDGGGEWSRLVAGTNLDLHAVWGSSASDLYVVGAEGVLLHSVDSGRTWTAEDSGVRDDLWGIWGSSADDIFLVGGHGTILHRQSP